MSLVFAGVTPHPPLLIPAIGKELRETLKKTEAALIELEQDLYVSKPNLIIVISPHTGRYEHSFCVNGHSDLESSYEQFGDLTTLERWQGSPDFAAKISHASRDALFQVRIVSQEKIDHGASIPLHFLTKHLPDIKVVTIGYNELDPKDHVAFGELLKNVIMDSDKRVAVIASGDLSHCHTTEAPGGYHDAAKKFDDTLIELLETRNTLGIVQMNQQTVADAQECVYRSLLILLGILKNMDYSFKNYAYETPHGVGYLVGNFAF